jgi:flagellin
LSTGLRINSGADDPAGLIASEALRSEVTGLNKAISNTQRASQIITTADSALGQVSSLLNDIRGLVVEAANSGALSDQEIAANQLQIDSSLDAINRIAQTTTFQGRKLLDGSLDYVSTVGTVGSVQDANINRAKIGSSALNVEVVVSSAASQAEATASSAAFSAAAPANASTPDARVGTAAIGGETITITGSDSFANVIIDDTLANGAGVVSYNATNGDLTISADFTNTNADATVIQSAIDALDGFVATGAAGAGTGGATPGTTATAAADALLDITAANSGADYNNVTVEFVSGAANAADYDSEQKVLTVTVNSAAPQTAAALATVIDGHTVDGSAPAAALFSAAGLANASIDIGDGVDSISTGNTGGEVLQDGLVFQLNGVDGAETFNFGSGTSATQIANAVNLVSDSTGVSATFASASLTFASTAYGTDALVNIDVISEGNSGTFAANLDTTRAVGSDIDATVNGVEATGAGNTLSINTSSLALSLTVDDSGSNFSFEISEGGATFQLGPDVSSTQQASIGIGSVSTGRLGGSAGRLYELGSGQAKSLINDVNGAADIIDAVISKVTGLRGRLGAFQSTTLESNLVSLYETAANLQEAESSIRDADFAQETANLTRAQILVQSGTSVLALANQNPQNVLALLR